MPFSSGSSVSPPTADRASRLLWSRLLVAACVVWAFVSFISSGNLDSYDDMLENYAWSSPWLLGTHKHPPFFAWVVGVWFTVFPNTDWAYRLLSYTNVAVGLAGVVFLGKRLGLGALAYWGALLLLWTFPYTSLAGKFNANSQLLSLWPWAAGLMLASWQARGAAAWVWTVLLGLVAAACMLSKYYSGVFLAGFLLPVLLHPQGRQWMCTPRPYVALLVFALAVLPHVAWMASHDWAPVGYAMSQGEGGVVWRYVVRFALAPWFYWLPAWLALCMVLARVQARRTGRSAWRAWGRAMVDIWRPQGRSDVLFWLAVAPWALTLLCGVLGVAELSTPWAIPIGYAFALLWLRNVQAADPQALATVLGKLSRAWWPVVGAVVVLGAVATVLSASKGDKGYYRPTPEAARAIVSSWQQRHPEAQLQWVGGDWAENAMVKFYALPQVHTVPDMPDSAAAHLAGLSHWRGQHGLLLCPLGQAAKRGGTPNGCQNDAQQWLAQQGLPAQPYVLQIARQGWRFPKPQAFAYAVYDVPPTARMAVGAE